MKIMIGIIFVTTLMIIAVMVYGEYMWRKGYEEGFEQNEKYYKEISDADSD